MPDQAQENTPLVQRSRDTVANAEIPWLQLFILCYARICEGWLFFTILPYIARMVEEAGVEHEQIGFYAGLVESAYSVTELLTMQFFWRSASDRYGRKPVMIASMAGIAVAATAFGFSKTVSQMIVSRAICGCFSGSIVTIRVMFSEISTEKTRATIFSYFALTGPVSAVLSPLVGGLLARPVERFPCFKNWPMFSSYPYLLPSLVAGALPASTAILAALFLKETKPSGSDYNKRALSARQLLKSSRLRQLLCIHTLVNYMNFAWMAIAPIFWYTQVEKGGLSMTTNDIAWLMGIMGAVEGSLAIICNSTLHRRFGTQGVLRLSTFGFMATFTLQPILNAIRRHLDNYVLVAFLALNVITVYTQLLAYFAISIAMVDVSPSPETLGSVVSLFLANAMLTRTVGPATGTSLYALGVDKEIAFGYFAWIFLALLAAASCVLAFTTDLYRGRTVTAT